jgi:hypothetical protein
MITDLQVIQQTNSTMEEDTFNSLGRTTINLHQSISLVMKANCIGILIE